MKTLVSGSSDPTSPMLSFLDSISAMARKDQECRRKAEEESAGFSALTFFTSSEDKTSAILAYLINPDALHGQRDFFLKALLETLGEEVGEMQSISIQTEVPCNLLDQTFCRKRMDVVIEYTMNQRSRVVVLESKSHGADDQPHQVKKYIEHMSAIRCDSRKLYYLNDGKPPSVVSIDGKTWNAGVSSGVCEARDFREVIDGWVSRCSSCKSKKMKEFISDFRDFALKQKRQDMDMGLNVMEEVMRIMQAALKDAAADRLDALLAIYSLHNKIGIYAVELCLTRVKVELGRKLDASWKLEVIPNPDSVNLTLRKQTWAADKYLYVCSEDSMGGDKRSRHLDLLSVGIEDDRKDKRLRLSNDQSAGLEDRVHWLLTSQAVGEIANKIIKQIVEWDPAI